MGKFISEFNAEENLDYVIELIKDRVAMDSRIKAFEDCTNYWKEKVEQVIDDESLNVHDRLKKISEMLDSYAKS